MALDRVLWCVREGQAPLPIGRASECQQYFFTQSCGIHLCICTPKALKGAHQLLCCMCAPAAHAAAGLRRPTQPERDLLATLTRARISELWVREAKLPWWHGQLDVWFPGPGLAVQVDGPHHFALQPRTPPARRQSTMDCAMCVAAWAACAGVVRVHHLHADSGAAAADVVLALRARRAWPGTPLLILGAGFTPDPCFAIMGERDAWAFLQALQDALKTPFTALPSGSVAFCPYPDLLKQHANAQQAPLTT